jgi:hypothetical protein
VTFLLRSCVVTVAREGSSKRVLEYGNVGPIELWAIQQAIDGIRSKIRWREAR